MNTYKITVAYDGTNYYGWQIQPKGISIAQVLQDHFYRIFKRRIKLLGSSRTDAGVHAVGQVARFMTDLNISASKMKWAWNNALPSDIIIRDLKQVDPSFYPLKSVKQKTYFYHIFLKKPLPFVARYGWYISQKLNIDILRDCLAVFVGTHDFRSFSCDEKDNTVRTIDSIKMRYVARFGCYQIEVKGQGFLRHMIRRIVGASVIIALSPERTMQEIQQALKVPNAQQTFFTAPALGLMLRKIIYQCS